MLRAISHAQVTLLHLQKGFPDSVCSAATVEQRGMSLHIKSEPEPSDYSGDNPGGSAGQELPFSSWPASAAISQFASGTMHLLPTLPNQTLDFSSMQDGGCVSHARHETDKPFRCPKCGASYVHFPSLSRHRRQCERKIEMACAVCEKRFHRKDHYWDHLRRAHHVTERLEPQVVYKH
ncbi:hypothetical protein BaRGS_00027549 [Batillaria attramentaria]|uniref:C2H2-type domain-containing protein n=1 Tax=Batillaria attramentaria TaxID=370345 RepID=A0ABD0K2K9_9CAEN